MPVHRFRAGDFLIAVSFWISRFGEMKSVPHPAQQDFTPKGFHRPTGRFHPSARSDFVEKTSFVFQTKEVFLVRRKGLDPPTYWFVAQANSYYIVTENGILPLNIPFSRTFSFILCKTVLLLGAIFCTKFALTGRNAHLSCTKFAPKMLSNKTD